MAGDQRQSAAVGRLPRQHVVPVGRRHRGSPPPGTGTPPVRANDGDDVPGPQQVDRAQRRAVGDPVPEDHDLAGLVERRALGVPTAPPWARVRRDAGVDPEVPSHLPREQLGGERSDVDPWARRPAGRRGRATSSRRPPRRRRPARPASSNRTTAILRPAAACEPCRDPAWNCGPRPLPWRTVSRTAGAGPPVPHPYLRWSREVQEG